MQREIGSRFGEGFEPHRAGEQHPSSRRGETRDGNEPVKSFAVWLQTFRSCISAGIQQAKQSRIDGLTKRCYRD